MESLEYLALACFGGYGGPAQIFLFYHDNLLQFLIYNIIVEHVLRYGIFFRGFLPTCILCSITYLIV